MHLRTTVYCFAFFGRALGRYAEKSKPLTLLDDRVLLIIHVKLKTRCSINHLVFRETLGALSVPE